MALDMGFSINVFQWILLALTVPFVCIRIYVQLRMRYCPWRELLILAAFFLNLENTITTSMTIDHDFYNLDVDLDAKPPQEKALMAKLTVANQFVYFNVMYCCKAILLLFYGDLTPRYLFPKTWWSIMATWATVVVGAFYSTFYQVIKCYPISRYWTMGVGGMPCGNTHAYGQALFVLHLVTDIIVYAIPFIILHNLRNMSSKQKLASYYMFAAGFFNILTALYCFIVFMTPSHWVDNTGPWVAFNNGFNYVTQLQTATAIMVVCMPQIRRLWLGTSEEAMRLERERMNGIAGAKPVVPILLDIETGIGSSSDGADESQHRMELSSLKKARSNTLGSTESQPAEVV